MHDWVNRELDLMLEGDFKSANSDSAVKDFVEKHLPYVRAMAALRARDPQKLVRVLQVHPELAEEMAQVTNRCRGRPEGTYGPNRKTLEGASLNVDRVRRLWQKHYGKCNRGRDNPPSAIEIVAERYKISEDAIAKFRKEHGRVLRD